MEAAVLPEVEVARVAQDAGMEKPRRQPGQTISEECPGAHRSPRAIGRYAPPRSPGMIQPRPRSSVARRSYGRIAGPKIPIVEPSPRFISTNRSCPLLCFGTMNEYAAPWPLTHSTQAMVARLRRV